MPLAHPDSRPEPHAEPRPSATPSQGKPRIGLVQATDRGFGGQPLAAARLARHMAEDVTLVPIWLAETQDPRDAAGRIEPMEKDGLHGYRIPATSRLEHEDDFPRCSRAFTDALLTLVEREGLQALQAHGIYGWEASVVAAAARAGLPLVASFRGSDINWRLFHAPSAIEMVLDVATVSTYMNHAQERVARRLFRPRGATFVIPNHVEMREFSNAAAPTLPLAGPTVGIMAQFRRDTGLDVLLRAFERLAPQRPISLLLVGPLYMAESSYYTRLLDSLPHASRVYRTGAVSHDRILGYMRACDLLVFPSIAEGLANKMLEAMVARVPVIASDVPGNDEIIDHGRDGLLFPSRDDEALARAIATLLDDPDQGRVYAERACEKVTTQFTAEREREGWRACYRAVGLLS